MIIGQCPVCGADMRVGSDMTNADRIRAMTDEELAGWLATNDTCPSTEQERNCNNRCGECWLEWLKQEAQCTSE